MSANPCVLNLHDINGMPINCVYVGPQANSLWAEDGRLHRCGDPPSIARCRKHGNGISDKFWESLALLFCCTL